MLKNNDLRYKITIKLYRDDKSFGPGVCQLLKGIDNTGSLSKAACDMNMAYSKAWRVIRSIEKEWGFALTVKSVGGSNGGGSILTPRGRLLVERYEALVAESNSIVGELFDTYYSEEFYIELLESQ